MVTGLPPRAGGSWKSQHVSLLTRARRGACTVVNKTAGTPGVPGWLAKGQSVRRHARDDTLRLKRHKDRKLSVGCGADPFWDVTGQGSLKDLAEPCGSCGIGKPPEDQADGEPAGAAPLVLEFAIALLDECSQGHHVGETTEAGLRERNDSPRVLVLCGLTVGCWRPYLGEDDRKLWGHAGVLFACSLAR